MALVKSHSNYVLKKKHQDISEGTIYERDITTIGGLNQFASGQIPIYKSGDFIITVRNDGGIENQYNTSRWEENSVSGDVWTLESLSGITSELKDANDLKIVLKQDYYELNDFAYYGSLSELFRVSVNDIVSRFPGELYGSSGLSIYYSKTNYVDGSTIKNSVILGGNEYFEMTNPFGIDIHSKSLPKDANPLKFFAEGGYQEYVLFEGDSTNPIDISSWDVTYIEDSPFCKGDKVATIVLNSEYEIEAWVGDDNAIYYLSKDARCNGLHIRPNEKHLYEFYNECDNFEKLLMNPKTTPRYKATFSIIKENEHGYYRVLDDFVFPTTYGGYNIDVVTYGFNDYTNKMVEVGEFYDDRFTDNLWRSMTHEAIKNFDWTYTREFNEGDEEENVIGGQKMQKALRLFARYFDETISFIENIKSVNRVTYNERDNIPDYFLTDVVENEGWDVKLVYPYSLKENVDAYKEEYQLNNLCGDTKIVREFTQDSTTEVKPYSNSSAISYFVVCNGCTSGEDELETPSRYIGTKYRLIDAKGRTTYFDACAFGGKGVLKDKIGSYVSNKPYTYKEVNNEFLRRLKINSKAIWRHKGTVEGIEMILGMFGFKSKKFVDRNKKSDFNGMPDYEIIEYSTFAPYINDWWDAVHQMYRIDWVNSTKLINYSNASDYVPYQGIPLSYNDIEGSYIDKNTNSSTTSDSDDSYTRSDGSLVLERRLYPNFNKFEEHDGNPYFQMDGGWLSKTIAVDGDKKYNFQYDADDNIVYSDYHVSGYTDESGFTVDNEFLYKETIRNIRRSDSIKVLLKTPTNQLWNGCVHYVTSIESNIMVIDGDVFNVIDEYYNNSTLHCVEFIKNNGYIRVGNKFFDESICVYDKDGNSQEYDLSNVPNGYSVYAYIKEVDGGFDFICSDYKDSYYSIETYTYVNGNVSGDTNYFVLDDVNYSYNLAKQLDDGTWTSGWRRLRTSDKEYLKLNTIENYYKGNNAHNGNMVYDNGHEYFTYFKRLFKYPIDNDLFDERCYSNYYATIDNEVSKYGFSGIIDDNEDIKQYDNKLINDNKIHFFGNYYSTDENGQCIENYYSDVKHADFGNSDLTNGYDGNVDGVTNQIMNNKRMTIKFNLHYEWYTKEGQEEIKYLDNIVMNYLTQMIPSATILDICYASK